MRLPPLQNALIQIRMWTFDGTLSGVRECWVPAIVQWVAEDGSQFRVNFLDQRFSAPRVISTTDGDWRSMLRAVS